MKAKWSEAFSTVMHQAVAELFPKPIATPYVPDAGAGAGAGVPEGLLRQAQGQGQATQGQGLAMVLPEGCYKPAARWSLAKVPAKREPVCFLSHRAFLSGKSLQAIAMEHKGGCKGGTIVGHMLDALTHGLPVDLVTNKTL